MSVVQHEISLRPHIWQQRVFWSKARFVGIIAGIRGGKTVIGSLAFLKDLTDRPSGSIGLITGPSLPDIKRTSIETIFNGVGPHRFGQWPRCEEEGSEYRTRVVCPNGHGQGRVMPSTAR
jgi:hypothetical protein